MERKLQTPLAKPTNLQTGYAMIAVLFTVMCLFSFAAYVIACDDVKDIAPRSFHWPAFDGCKGHTYY